MPVMFVADGVLRTGLPRGHAAHKTPSTPSLVVAVGIIAAPRSQASRPPGIREAQGRPRLLPRLQIHAREFSE